MKGRRYMPCASLVLITSPKEGQHQIPIARKAGVKLIVKNHLLSYLYRAHDL